MKRIFISALLQVALWTVLTGLVYPLFVMGIAQVGFKKEANGSLIRTGETVRGSELIAQKFVKPEFFWPRPSAVNYNPMPSGGSNWGPTSTDLVKAVNERKTLGLHDDLLFASGSGLDPHIHAKALPAEVDRVATARNLDATQRLRLSALANRFIETPTLGFLGEARVNILKLNAALTEEFH